MEETPENKSPVGKVKTKEIESGKPARCDESEDSEQSDISQPDNSKPGTSGAKKRTKRKDSSAPKQPLTAFRRYSDKHRNTLRDIQSSDERKKILRSIWKNLPLDEKRPYEDDADQDQKRFDKEWDAYIQTDEYKQQNMKRLKASDEKEKERRKRTPQPSTSLAANTPTAAVTNVQEHPGQEQLPDGDEAKDLLDKCRRVISSLDNMREKVGNLVMKHDAESGKYKRRISELQRQLQEAQNELESSESAAAESRKILEQINKYCRNNT